MLIPLYKTAAMQGAVMEGISDIKITGIDATRPPRIRKEPYINLYFRLSHKAPARWCDDFNTLLSKGQYSAKIEPKEGVFIETWVRKVDEVEPAFDKLKEAVALCSEQYIERMAAEARAAAQDGDGPVKDEGEQGRLNRILAGLKFDA